MEILILTAGIIQLSILSASILVPTVMEYSHVMVSLKPMMRKLIWVYGVYVAGTILFMGLLSVLFPARLLDGGVMKFILLFYVIFWGGRLYLQIFVYEMKEFLTEWWMRAGYNMLTLSFIFLTTVYLKALLI
jgi:hypothetical protein